MSVEHYPVNVKSEDANRYYIDTKIVSGIAKPLADYIKEHYDLHTTIIVTADGVKVVRDELGIPFGGDSE